MTQSTALSFPEAYAALRSGQLPADVVERAFGAMLEGHWTAIQIAGFLGGIGVLPESAEVIGAAASAMRSAMLPVEHQLPAVLDTCGTGGDSSGSVNLSTGAAIICAAADVKVAKHGNRAATSKAGSADVLQALGVVELPPALVSRVLTQCGIVFMTAPLHHPALRFAGPVRKELGVRTLFNCLGPLANPARATHQLLGAFSNSLRPLLAQALRDLGTQRAWVVWGREGLDEVSPFGPTCVTELDQGQLREFEISPGDFGLPLSPPGATAGDTPEYNAQVLLSVLKGEPHVARDAFLLNAAAALVVALKLSPPQALARAQQAVDSGAALKTLERWKAAVHAALSEGVPAPQ